MAFTATKPVVLILGAIRPANANGAVPISCRLIEGRFFVRSPALSLSAPDMPSSLRVLVACEFSGIVRACNAHAGLVASLTEYKEAIAEGREITLGMAMRSNAALSAAKL